MCLSREEKNCRMKCIRPFKLLFILFLASSSLMACSTMTPLTKATRDGDINKINALISSGGNVNERDPETRRTPLHNAVSNNQVHVVEFLIEKGASVNIADEWGYTPLILALQYCYSDVAKTLIERGANINAADGQGWTPLALAVYCNNKEMVTFLLEKGAAIDIPDKYGNTSLIQAVIYGDSEMVKTLIEEDADIDVANQAGVTALIQAANSGNAQMAKILIEEGADIDVANQAGVTALIQAINSGNIDAAELLIEKGADVLAVDSNGYKAYDYAKYALRPTRKIFKVTEFYVLKAYDYAKQAWKPAKTIQKTEKENERWESLLKLLKDTEARQVSQDSYRIKYPLRAKITPVVQKVQQCMTPDKTYDIFINYREQPYIQVNLTGTITYSKGAVEKWDEDMLLLATAHEIAHDKLNHAIKNKVKYMGILSAGTGAIIAAQAIFPPLFLLNQIMGITAPALKTVGVNDKKQQEQVSSLFAVGYTQSQEQEADQLAAESCGRCFGMTKEKLSEVLRSMKEKSRSEGGGFRSSHPWVNRIERMKESQ